MKKRQKLHIVKIVCLLVLFDFATSFAVYSQSGVAINLTGTISDPSAMLDVSSTNSGILIPRMTEAQKLAIANPAVGLMIYQTDGVSGFWYYDGSIWGQSLGATGATGATGADGATGPAGLLPSGTLAGNTPYWDGTQWVVSSSNIFNNGGSVGIGTNSPDASALIDLNSNTKGTLITRMSANERNAISNPAIGLMIFNTDCENIDIYVSNGWTPLNASTLTPQSPSALSNLVSETQIVWNWSSVNGAGGYKYNTVNNYSSAIDNGLNTSFTQSSLTCNTSYTLYVWAYSPCGYSNATALTQTTSVCFVCGNTVTFTYKGSNVTYGTVSRNGECWLDRNLGALAVATAYNHFNAYGDMFQWGRGDDGHQVRTSNTTTTLSSNNSPGHSNFIVAPLSPYNWLTPAQNNLWQGASGINNPCPSGWRLPTETELNSERVTWSSQNTAGAFASTLKWTSGGYRNYYNGIVELAGSDSHYWSSTIDGSDAKLLNFYSGGANTYGDFRGYGRSVRCIKD